MKKKKAAVWVTMMAAMVLFASACGRHSEGEGFSSAGKGQNATASYGEDNRQEDNWQAGSRQPDNRQEDKRKPNNRQEENLQEDTRQQGDRKPENQNDKGNQEQEIKKLDGFKGQADLEGSVYEFTETGFSLSPAETYEDGNGSVMAQAAPGAEDTSKLVTITYSEDCIFQIVVMDLSSLKEVSREDATSESIKKQTQVKVYGSCQDTTHWTAEGILIVRWQ